LNAPFHPHIRKLQFPSTLIVAEERTPHDAVYQAAHDEYHQIETENGKFPQKRRVSIQRAWRSLGWIEEKENVHPANEYD
jgi:hypothetical protein